MTLQERVRAQCNTLGGFAGRLMGHNIFFCVLCQNTLISNWCSYAQKRADATEAEICAHTLFGVRQQNWKKRKSRKSSLTHHCFSFLFQLCLFSLQLKAGCDYVPLLSQNKPGKRKRFPARSKPRSQNSGNEVGLIKNDVRVIDKSITHQNNNFNTKKLSNIH